MTNGEMSFMNFHWDVLYINEYWWWCNLFFEKLFWSHKVRQLTVSKNMLTAAQETHLFGKLADSLKNYSASQQKLSRQQKHLFNENWTVYTDVSIWFIVHICHLISCIACFHVQKSCICDYKCKVVLPCETISMKH